MLALLLALEETERCEPFKDVPQGELPFGLANLPRNMAMRQFRQFAFGDAILSVQASAYHFCSPRETLIDPLDYRSMEMAILSKEGRMKRVMDVLPDFAAHTDIEGYYSAPVYSQVPVELLNELYLALTKAYGKGT